MKAPYEDIEEVGVRGLHFKGTHRQVVISIQACLVLLHFVLLRFTDNGVFTN